MNNSDINFDEIQFGQMSETNRRVARRRDELFNTLTKELLYYNSFIRGEKDITKDYAGREVLELLQNADDASNDGDEIQIELEGNHFRAYNNGKEFTVEEGIESLFAPYTSQKDPDINSGNKGLGIRALLNSSLRFEIYSKDLSVQYSKENAEEYVRARQLSLGTPPILSVPRIIKCGIDSKNFITVVDATLINEDACVNIERQFEELDEKTLIFLRHATQLRIITPSVTKFYHKSLNGEVCKVDYYENEEYIKTYEFLLIREEYRDIQSSELDENGNFKKKNVKFSLAYNLDEEMRQEYQFLYTYFKTNVLMPTNWLINADFELESNRKDLREQSSLNWFLLTRIIDRIFDYTENFTKKSKIASWLACDYIIGNYEKFDDSLQYDGVTIKKYFIEKLKEAKILPTVNNEYISFLDSPEHYRTEITKHLKGEDFEKLLKYAEDVHYDEFVESRDEARTPTASEITPKINRILPNLDIAKRIALLINFQEEYPYEKYSYPDFFLDQHQNPIPSTKDKYTEPTDRKIYKGLPEYLDFSFIDNAMITKLRDALEISSEQFESNEVVKYYGIHQYRIDNIVRKFYNQVYKNSLIEKSRTIDFINWIYSNKIPYEKLNNYLDGNSIRLFSTTSKIYGVDKLHFTQDYGYPLYANIFPDSNRLLLDYYEFRLPDSEKSDFVVYLKTLGVRTEPNLEEDGMIGELNQRKWIELHGDKYAPRDIIFNKDYDRKFDGIIGVYREELSYTIKEPNFCKACLDKLDFNEHIEDFSEETIYKILLSLPKVDPSGELATNIQNRLAREIESQKWNQNIFSNETQTEFFNNGKVFCKDGEYHLINETRYLDDGKFPKAILKEQPLLDTYRKMGAEKIKAIFGVSKFQANYEICGQVTIAPENIQFQKELNNFKVGIIASNKITTSEEVKQDIKSLKVILGSKIKLRTNSGKIRTLEPYDVIEQKGQYYIETPPNQKWLDLRYDPEFIDAITTAFICRIKNDSAEEEHDSIYGLIGAHDIRKFICLQDNGKRAYCDAEQYIYNKTKISDDELRQENYEKTRRLIDEKMLEQYRQSLYVKLINCDVSEQEKYNEHCENFRYMTDIDYDDPAFVQPGFDAEKFLIEKFFRPANLDEKIKNDTGNQLYRKLYEELQKDEQDILVKSSHLCTLAQFGQYKLVKQEIRKELEAKLAIVEVEPVPKKETPISEVEFVPQEIVENPPENNKPRRRGGGGYGGVYRTQSNEGRKKENGRIAQERAKKYLSEQGFINVIDVSGYALESGENVNGSDDKGYDLECEKDGCKYYIEVKSAEKRSNRISFLISRNEYETACQKTEYGQKYCVLYINGTESSKPGVVLKDWNEIYPDLLLNEYSYEKGIRNKG